MQSPCLTGVFSSVFLQEGGGGHNKQAGGGNNKQAGAGVVPSSGLARSLSLDEV